jgi:hypothetical protein
MQAVLRGPVFSFADCTQPRMPTIVVKASAHVQNASTDRASMRTYSRANMQLCMRTGMEYTPCTGHGIQHVKLFISTHTYIPYIAMHTGKTFIRATHTAYRWRYSARSRGNICEGSSGQMAADRCARYFRKVLHLAGTHKSVCTCMWVCMSVWVCGCEHVCMRAYACECLYACMHL